MERLKREQEETDGTITLRTSIEGQTKSVMVVLSQSDYHLAIQAHEEKAPIILEGDLEYTDHRWRVLNPHIIEVIRYEILLTKRKSNITRRNKTREEAISTRFTLD